ncbi:DNA-3-methyladenine glycosylase I [Falsirhodobacter halotolerans]|uniref:DNA-3-methyladenine glycosylase I n=1 Tax=Falsirhodobacter halotolerans TaxID=1146892 RepID=UPI001FD511B2|nr:DNA-3-methyladenine glycosylase I [Falsirhodobacter halotolerans]MCJ8140518.1 DNA-3-methyladenine glycosylase I [Falsirhodobacter halotolerans]
MPRCHWCGTDPLYVAYHDTEWGVPEYDSRSLWEKLILDGFQAGLSWITILRRRDGFRAAFEGFHPEAIATWGEPEITRLLADPRIIRHRGKIEATIGNARAYLDIPDFSAFLWDYVGGAPLVNAPATPQDIPTESELSRQISRDLRKKGFKFCGPTITYAFLQATGLINDHLATCPAQAGPITA